MGPLFNSGHGMVTATLTETVNMPGYVVPSATNTMVVFPDSSSIPADGAPINVNVRAGGAYTVVLSEDWVHCQKYQHGLTLFADPNAQANKRDFTATLTLSADTTQTVTLMLSQSGFSDAGFAVTPGLATASAYGDDSNPVVLHASGSWQAESLTDWLLVYNENDKIQYVGYGETLLHIKAMPNYSGVVRKGLVRFYGNGEATYTLIQQPAEFSVSVESLTFEAAGGSQTIELKPILSDDLPALNVQAEGTGLTAAYANGVITVTAEANTTANKREGHIDITINNNGDVAVVYVTQLGA